MTMKTNKLIGKKIKVIEAMPGSTGANGMVGTVVKMPDVGLLHSRHGLDFTANSQKRDIFVLLKKTRWHKDPGLWNIGAKAKYIILDEEWDEEENS